MDVEVLSTEKETEHKDRMNIGQQLTDVREALGLSRVDVARQLNLNQDVIAHLEENNFNYGLPMTFVKGYLRSYAKKMGLDVETICVEFDRQVGTQNAYVQRVESISTYTASSNEMNTKSTVFRLFTGLIVVAIVGVGSYEVWKKYFNSDTSNNVGNEIILDIQIDSETQENDQTLEQIQGVVQDESVEPVAVNDVSSRLVMDTEDKLINQQQVEAVNENDEVEVGAKVDNNELDMFKPRLTSPVVTADFSFSGDCWVEITDANGDMLASGIKNDGKTMNLQGIAPLTVVLGDPSVVSMTFNDQPYDMTRFKPQRTARIILQ
ncbi:MAG: DUF4115 domain-containing protein [Gammaproteobacteria bacterium]|nr:DUF4115 domain-containing protein [Gammaproteobacteria bacterium]